jgi:hypothetical protein
MDKNEILTSIAETEQEPVTPQTPETETPKTEPTAPEPVAPQPQPEEPQIDYKEKFAASTREAQRLAKELEDERNRIKSLTNNDPTESELRERYPEWDQLDAYNQRVLKNMLATEKRTANLQTQLLEQEAERKWQSELRDLTRKSEYKSLKDDPEFENYVFQPKHKGLDIETLADAFLHKKGDTNTPAPENPGGLEKGSGGPKEAPKTKLKPADVEAMRTNDPKKFRELLSTGAIELGE